MCCFVIKLSEITNNVTKKKKRCLIITIRDDTIPKRNLLFTSGNIEYITATPLTSLNLNVNSNLYPTVLIHRGTHVGPWWQQSRCSSGHYLLKLKAPRVDISMEYSLCKKNKRLLKVTVEISNMSWNCLLYTSPSPRD